MRRKPATILFGPSAYVHINRGQAWVNGEIPYADLINLLDQATTSSPEALQFLALGYINQLSGDTSGALSYYRRAIEKDPTSHWLMQPRPAAICGLQSPHWLRPISLRLSNYATG